MRRDGGTLNGFGAAIRPFLLPDGGVRIRYGMGCAWLGRSHDYRRHLRHDLRVLGMAYELGFRYLDTAPAYGNSEKVVGEFLATIPRNSVFVATKSHVPAAMCVHDACEFVRSSLAESLRRLGTDHLDLFQLHDMDTLSSVLVDDGVIDVLVDAQRQAMVRYFGVATRSHRVLQDAVGSGRFDTILTYSDFTPINRSATTLMADAKRAGLGVINASPLSGVLSPGNRDFAQFCAARHVTMLEAALHFPLTNPDIDITLTGPATVDEVQSTVAALGAPFDDQIWSSWT